MGSAKEKLKLKDLSFLPSSVMFNRVLSLRSLSLPRGLSLARFSTTVPVSSVDSSGSSEEHKKQPKKNIFEDRNLADYGDQSKAMFLEKYAKKITKTMAE